MALIFVKRSIDIIEQCRSCFITKFNMQRVISLTLTILSLKHGTADRVMSENTIRLTKSLSLNVSSIASIVAMAISKLDPDIDPDESSKII